MMEADDLERNPKERPSQEYRVMGCGIFLFMTLSYMLLVFSCLEPNRQGFKYVPTEAELKSDVPEATNVIGWGRNVSRDATVYIDPLNDTTIIPGKEICRNQTTLVIIVPSSPPELSRRALIRETWGACEVESQVKIGFFVGLTKNQTVQISLERESKQFRDIIQENIIDTYNNLTLKSIALLKWYNSNCRNSSFLMKTDVDTFVNVEALVSYLTNYRSNGVLMGHVWHETLVPRAANDRFAIPKFMYRNEVYPDFLSGGAYVMSSDVAEALFAAALKIPIIHLEDVFITGLCARKAGVTPEDFPGSSFKLGESISGVLICWPNHTMCHPVGSEDMQSLWEKRRDPTSLQMQFPNLQSP